MSASPLSPGADMGNHWEFSSGASSPRSDTSSNTNSLFSSPDSPADTELSFPSLGSKETEEVLSAKQSDVSSIPAHPYHILAGNALYTTGNIRQMSEELQQARKRGEFPTTASAVEDPQTIVEDYQHLQRLRSARGDPAVYPPPQQYNVIKVDIARRIKARDEMQGAPANFQEVDHRVQNWMSSINKEARMLEITQAALQRKGINNPTQDDLDAIAEEFMQIAERTLLDVANPLRMNTTRLAGNIDRFDSQLNGLSSIDGAMTAQLDTLNSVLSTLNGAVGMSADAMGMQLNTLNTILAAQSNTFNGSVTMINQALNIVNTDLQQLTSNIPAMVAAAVQDAVSQHLSAVTYQQQKGNCDQPPGYATAIRVQQNQTTGEEFFGSGTRVVASTVHVSGQAYEQISHQNMQPTKSRFRKFLRVITGRGQSKKGAGSK